MPSPIRRHPVLQVDAAPIDMERRSVHCCRDGPRDRGHACVYHVLPGGAVELSKGSTQPGEERVIGCSGLLKGNPPNAADSIHRHQIRGSLWARHQT
jgi:hypothetical protein